MVYHGPREGILPFFTSVGMTCPARKAEADFLQEVTSRKDQQVPLRVYSSTLLTPLIQLPSGIEGTTYSQSNCLQTAAASCPSKGCSKLHIMILHPLRLCELCLWRIQCCRPWLFGSYWYSGLLQLMACCLFLYSSCCNILPVLMTCKLLLPPCSHWHPA